MAKVRIRIAQHQALHDSEKTVYKSSVKPPATEKSDLSLESTLSCANCSLPHSVDKCRKPCVKHPSDKHSGAHCPDLRSTQKKVATVSTSASPFSFLNPSTTVIFDSGSGVNTVPSQNFLSSRNQIPTTLELQTAGAHRFSSTLSGNFRGLHSHVVPEFSDVLISLSNLLSAGNFAIVTDTKMVVVDSNSITVPLLQSFQHAILNSIKFTVPVVDGIYQHSLSDLPSALVTSNSTSRLMNVIHRYETAKFHTLSDLVLFFHDLLGHPSIDTMLAIVQSSAISNLPSDLTASAIRKYFPFNCSTCPASQLAVRPPAPLLPSTTSFPGEEFEVDFKGPWTDATGAQISSFSNNKYSFTAVDVHADYAYASFARTTKNPVQYLERLRLFALKKTGNRLKVLRVGNEFMDNTAVHSWADQPEINVTILPAIPNEHDRITKVERLHRTLQDMVNKTLHGKPHLGSRYWEKSYRHCIDLYNIRPRASLSGTSPYYLYYKRPYNFKVNPIFPFGSVIMGHIPLDSQTALSGRADEMFFEGIAHDFNNGIKLYNPVSKQTVTRHTYAFVDVQEPSVNTYILPSSAITSSELSADNLLPPSLPSSSESVLCAELSSPSSDSVLVSSTVPSSISVEGGPISITDEGGPTLLSSSPALDDLHRWSHISLPYSSAPSSVRPKYDHIGRNFTDMSLNTKFQITDICISSAPDFQDIYTFKFYDTSIFSAPPSLEDLFEYEEINSFLQDSNYRFDSSPYPYLRRRVNQLLTQKRLHMPTIPLSVDQAKAHEHAEGFLSALDDEISSLWNMSTWKVFSGDIKSIPPGRLIGSKVIFDIVYNPDGTFKKFKARIVARGDQLRSFDSNNFAGTVKSETMRILLAVVAEQDLDHDSLDVKTAFLYPPLKSDDRTWLRRPRGLTDAHMPPVVELLKSIYGLPKASQYFEDYLSTHLLQLGFKRTISDKQLFLLRRPDHSICYLSTHVDDIFLACTKDSGLNDWVRDQLALVFTLSHRPNTTVHLGLVIERDRANKSLKISQSHYITETLTRFGISSSNTLSIVDSPMSEYYLRDMPLHSTDPILDSTQITIFQEIVGCLQYLTDQTRPDLKYSTNQLSRRSLSPTARDMKAAKRVLRYLSQTISSGITFCTYGLPFELFVTVDVSYNCYPDSKSHTGFSFHLGRFSGAVFAFSRKQAIIADSSTAAEFIGTHKACQQIGWTQNLLSEMGVSISSPTVVYQDNLSTIKLIAHKGNEARTKHIDLRYNVIREFLQQARIVVRYLSTENMIADMLTKPLPGPSFSRLTSRLLNLSPPTDLDLTLV